MAASPEVELLTALLDHINAAGLAAAVLEPEEARPYHTLICKLEDLGEADRALNMEISVPPGVSDADTGSLLLQLFVGLHSDLDSGRDDDLLWLTGQLNTRLPIGNFGIMQDARLVYYKNSLVIDGGVDTAAQVRSVDLQIGLMLHVLQTFLDVVLAVSEGAQATRALADHPLAAVFANAS